MLDTSDAVVKALVDAAQVSGASTNGFLAGMKGCKAARVVGEPGSWLPSGSGGCSIYNHELMESLGWVLIRLFLQSLDGGGGWVSIVKSFTLHIITWQAL